jgi:hypothetical protein
MESGPVSVSPNRAINQAGDPAHDQADEEAGAAIAQGCGLMRHIRSAAITMVLVIILVILLAEAIRPFLPWLIALIIIACIVKLVMRS